MNSIGINSIGYKGLRPLFYWYWQNVKVLLKLENGIENRKKKAVYLDQTKGRLTGPNINQTTKQMKTKTTTIQKLDKISRSAFYVTLAIFFAWLFVQIIINL